MTMVTFDTALPTFAHLVSTTWGAKAFEDLLFLRDVSGRLTLVVNPDKYPKNVRAALAVQVEAALGAYVDSGGYSIVTAEELFDDRLKDEREVRVVNVAGSMRIRLVDRRMVGADWLRLPSTIVSKPHRLAFTSIKGGVGRSTALCVLASHFAASGKRVLAIDMDLEAPGLGNMLLPDETLPEFGLLDYLVERAIGELPDTFYVDLVGSSWVGGGLGRVDVIPAIGRRSMNNPANVLGKIARAYLSTGELENSSTFTDHIESLLVKVADQFSYDVVLIDARAGLHETTAASFIGLGAHVFLFGIDQSQTFAGFNFLLSHLAILKGKGTWLDQITFVQAKADLTRRAGTEFESQVSKLISAAFEVSGIAASKALEVEDLSETFEVGWQNVEATVVVEGKEDIDVVSIEESAAFRFFDPINNRASLEAANYESAYKEFLVRASNIVNVS